MTNKIILVVALAFLIGCAGNPFSFDSARKITVGMSETQLIGAMGEPYQKTAKKDCEVWLWSFSYGLFYGQSVSFIMKDGKVSGLPSIPITFH